MLLKVSAPFHCALMAPAQQRLARDLDQLQVTEPAVPLVNNVQARIVCSAQEVRDGLKQQVTSPVRWEQSMRLLRSEGVEIFVEVGPGKVLSGLVRQIHPEAECLRVEDLTTLNDVLARLGLVG
jgi:[acyl-carrier-protein] S-malonyltransferase